MRRWPAALRLVSLVGLAFAGLVGGHAIGYALAIPDAHHRAALVAETGHGYLPSVSWVALVCGLAALLMGIAAGYLRHGPERGRIRHAAWRIVPMQAAAFAAIEVLERLASGASLTTLSPTLLLIGAAVQMVVGLTVALLIVGLRKVGSALRAGSRIANAVRTARRLEAPCERLFAMPGRSSNRVRAPPPAHAI